MESLSKLIKNTGILYVRLIITSLISLYSTRLILNALGISDFGLFNLILGVIGILSFLNSSMSTTTQRFISICHGSGDIESVKQIFNISFILHLIVAFIVIILFESAWYFIFENFLNINYNRINSARFIFHIMVVSVFFTVLTVPYEAMIISHGNMIFYGVLGIIESLLKLLIAIYITFSSQDHLVIYGVLSLIVSILILIIKIIYCHKIYLECTFNFNKYYDKKVFYELKKFALWNLLGSISSLMLGYGQNIIINIFFGTIVNASQSISRNISTQLSILSLTLIKVLNPIIDKSEGSGNREKMINFTLYGTKLSFFITSIFLVTFFIEMPYILKLWLKNVPNYTSIFCYLMSIGTLFEIMFMPLNHAIYSVGKVKIFNIIDSLLNLITIIISIFILNLHFPPQSFYIITLIFIIIKSFNSLIIAKKFIGVDINFFIKKIIIGCLFPFILTLIFSCLPHYFLPPNLERLALVFLCSIILYPFFIWFLSLDNIEKNIIKFGLYNIKSRIK
jgi:O-antigen/teichoic acid export membrane protein